MICRELDERYESEVTDVRRTIAATKVEMQQQHTMLLQHAQALTEEVSQLAAEQERVHETVHETAHNFATKDKAELLQQQLNASQYDSSHAQQSI